ncbi:MAG: SRPBCC domain-containing protein [Ferruginibacter sp.]
MPVKEIWINLPVKDLTKSKVFFKALGFTQNTTHGNTNENACFVVGEKNVAVMLFPEAVFKTFTRHEVSDTRMATEVLLSIDAETREEVDNLAASAAAAGGNVFGEPAEIRGWMYGCGFTDLDGHRWNVLHMDKSKMPQQSAALNKDCIIINTTVKATAEKVWEYWTKPEHIKKWNYASEDWHTTKAENDLTVGGTFSSRMEAKDGSMGFDFCGHYSHIKELEDIAYMIGDSRKVNIHFEKTADGIKITETFEPETENSQEMQQHGWQAILNNFKTYTENN